MILSDYISIGIYWLLVFTWGLIVLVFLLRYDQPKAGEPRTAIIARVILLLGFAVLAIDSIYFSAWFTARDETSRTYLFTNVLLGEYLLIPKVGLLIAGIAVLILTWRNRLTEIEEETENMKRMSALYAIAATVSQSLNLEEMFSGTLEKVLEVTRLETGAIALVDEQGGTLSLAVHRGFPEGLLHEADSLKLGHGLTGRAAQSGKPLLVEDMSEESDLSKLEREMKTKGFRSFACIPLGSREKVLGVMDIASHDLRQFSHQDVELLTAIGNQIGVAIHAEKERERLRKLAVVANPYIDGEPIRSEEMFFGREEILKRILSTIHNNSIMFHGERRIGKTSLLYQIANWLAKKPDPDYFFISTFVDLQGVEEEHFFAILMEDILQDCQQYLPQRPTLRFDAKRDSYTFRDFEVDLGVIINSLQQTTPKKVRLVLLMDEVDVMRDYDQIVQQRLRRIFMKRYAENLGTVVTGVTISKEWERRESPFYNLFSEMRLSSLSEEEAIQLIREPVAGMYKYTDGAAESIIQHSRGRPQIIQRICMHAVHRLLESERRTVTEEDMQHIYENIIVPDEKD
jgi:hypothetical protein